MFWRARKVKADGVSNAVPSSWNGRLATRRFVILVAAGALKCPGRSRTS